ncbi:MAG: sulfatase-like hydrolase/transferase [Spirochaetales bacterium]|nr:sulfatase-like hydrolase/transferase [Spirochaetales bacterium]
MKKKNNFPVMGSAEAHELRLAGLKSKQKKPNILLLITDQQRYDTVHAGGFNYMITPNLDRLAEEGIYYKNAYSPNPICMPARHNLLTGLTARYHGYPDNTWGYGMPLGIPTFPQILSDNGYETHTIGKNHFYPLRRHNGYERMELMTEVPSFREQDDYTMYLKNVGLGNIQDMHGVRNLLFMLPQRSLIPEEHHGNKWVADRAIDFLKTNRGRHPFLLKASWIAPHPPFDVVDEYAHLYDNVDIPDTRTSKTSLCSLAEESKMLGDIPNDQYLRRMKQLYFSSITHVDYHLGRILDTLEDTGLAENTIVLFFSDHGEMLGDYGTYQKWLPYDSCARVPFIVRFPDKFKPEVGPDEFVDWNDILPTILDAAGIEYPAHYPLSGESLLRKEENRDRNIHYMEYSAGSRRWISLRDKRYKYNYYYGGGREELFDLKDDPLESENLLETRADNEIKEIKNNLKVQLIEYEKKWGLEGYIVGGDFVKLESYKPRPSRNKAFPIFPDMIMDEKEKAEMNKFFDEVLMAIEKEPVVKLKELDLHAWQKNGHFTDEQIRNLLEAEKKMKRGN